MFRDERLHQLVDRFSGGKGDLDKGHAGNAKVVPGLARCPGDRDRQVDLIVAAREMQYAVASLGSQEVTHQASATKAEVANHEVAFRPIDFELSWMAHGDSSMKPDFEIVLFEEDIRKHEADRFVRRVVPEMPANAMMSQGGDDLFGRSRSDRNERRGRDTETFRHVGYPLELDTRCKEDGVDSPLRLPREHLRFVDVIRIVNVEISTNQIEGEML